MGAFDDPDKFVGSWNNKPMVAVAVRRSVFARVKELTAVGLAPDWILEPGMPPRVLTTDPAWFADIDRQLAMAGQ